MTRLVTRPLAWLALSSLVACGDKSDEDEDDDGGSGGSDPLDCFVEVSLTGAFEADVSWDSEQGCSSFSWGLDSEPVVKLWINEGFDGSAPSQALTGTVGLMDQDFNEWRSESDGCAVAITNILPDADFEDWYWVEGAVTCPGVLVDEANGTEVTAGPLTFRGTWLGGSDDTGG
jgi:hypothetical protein